MIVSTEDLGRYRGAVTMVDGGFDPLHHGHVAYFEAAAALGLPVLCNVSSDEWVARKHPPLLDQAERAAIIDAIRWVDYTHLSAVETVDVLRLLSPRYYAKGADWEGRLPDGRAGGLRSRSGPRWYTSTPSWTRRRQSSSGMQAASRRGSALRVRAVVTHHRDGFRSGVARFNELLADRLGVPLQGVEDDGAPGWADSLLSFKAGEMSAAEQAALAERLARADWHGQAYLHEYGGLDLEREILARARRVHCGNLEIYEQVRGLNPEASPVWTPGLLVDRRDYEPAEISVFSFGMAHKIRADMFGRLRELLDGCGRSYAVYVSAANHETSSLGDAEVIFEGMHAIFPSLYFLGNLSDVAVHNQLRQSTFFAAFFPGGVRANNTTVAAAMETGAVVITNLDEFSPPEYVHLENVIDLERCDELPSDPAVLARLRERAVETTRGRGWGALVERMTT